MKWLKNRHPSDRAAVLEQILERTGIGQEITAELAKERADRHAAAAKRKADAIAKHLRDKGPAESKLEEISAKEIEAKKAAERLLLEYIAARESLETMRQTLRAETDECDALMRDSYPEQIDDFSLELDTLLVACEGLVREQPDPNGTITRPGSKIRFSNNYEAVQRRARAILAAKDAVERLKVDPNVTDFVAALKKIRSKIPEA